MTDYDVQLKAGARRSLEEAISETYRELQVRERCYPRWIRDGKLSKTDAKDRGERLESAIQFLKYFQDWIAADDLKSKKIDLLKQPVHTPEPLGQPMSNDPPQIGDGHSSAECG